MAFQAHPRGEEGSISVARGKRNSSVLDSSRLPGKYGVLLGPADMKGHSQTDLGGGRALGGWPTRKGAGGFTWWKWENWLRDRERGSWEDGGGIDSDRQCISCSQAGVIMCGECSECIGLPREGKHEQSAGRDAMGFQRGRNLRGSGGHMSLCE